MELYTPEKTKHRLNYLHEKPVSSALVWDSSAIDYYINEHGLIKVVPIDIGIVVLIPDAIGQIYEVTSEPLKRNTCASGSLVLLNVSAD